MKTLYLVRHAKSSWKDLTLDDFDRPLNKRGKRDAPFMGQKLKEKGILPDLIMASSAKRAKRTAKIIAEQIGYSLSDIVFKKSIYDATERSLLNLIRAQSSSINSLMLFGHNPEFTFLSNALCSFHIDNIPTTGISCINFDVEKWEDLTLKSGKHAFFDYPKNYTELQKETAE